MELVCVWVQGVGFSHWVLGRPSLTWLRFPQLWKVENRAPHRYHVTCGAPCKPGSLLKIHQEFQDNDSRALGRAPAALELGAPGGCTGTPRSRPASQAARTPTRSRAPMSPSGADTEGTSSQNLRAAGLRAPSWPSGPRSSWEAGLIAAQARGESSSWREQHAKTEKENGKKTPATNRPAGAVPAVGQEFGLT